MKNLNNIIESILFVSGKAVEIAFIAEKLEVPVGDVNKAIEQLKQRYSGESGIHLLTFNKKAQFSSNPEYVKSVESVLNPIKEKELTNAMLETLAIVAYKQPVTRVEIEEIRGVDCTYSVQNLTRLGLIEAVGRKESIGKPLLFATTDEFLKRFSLTSIDDLPDHQALLGKLQSIEQNINSVTTVEKPMFNTQDIPEFLEGEKVEVVE